MKKQLALIVTSIAMVLSCQKAPEEVPVSSVSLDQASVEMAVGDVIRLSATVLPSDATDKSVKWSSSNTSVASVDGGNVVALAEGNTTITATAGEKTATCSVTVKKKIVHVTSVELNKTKLSLVEGDTETLTATVKPIDATDKTVTWSTSDASIAEVEDGVVVTKQEGKATITATAGTKSATCKVDVAKRVIPVESIELNKTELALHKGESETLTVTVKPDDATDKTVRWSCSDPYIVEVDQAGKITAMNGGSATVIATVGDKEASCVVTVTVPVESITLDKTELSMLEGDEMTLSATVNPSDATDKTVTWATSDAEIATVENGKVSAIKEGVVAIMAKAGEKEAQCIITVQHNTMYDAITFADSRVKEKLVAAFDSNNDGEISYLEASVVSSMKGVFDSETDPEYVSFDEYQYFTGLTMVEESLFKNWSKLQSIVLPETVTWIYKSAFENATALKSIAFPERVYYIGASAFRNCYNLELVQLPSLLDDIRDYAFYGCTGMVGELSLPANLNYIRNYAFAGCTGLKGDLVIPDAIWIIGEGAFSGCTGLDGKLIIPLESTTDGYGQLNIGNKAFLNCRNFKGDLVISSKINLGSYCFQSAGFTGSVYTSKTGHYSFYDCKIGGNLVIDDSVTKIGSTFRAVQVAGFVYIGKNAVLLSTECFYVCSCNTFYVAAPTPPICEQDAISLSGRFLGVPVGRMEAYKNAEPWKNASTIEEVDFSQLKLKP